jgi:uncharacterized surface anchored protein
VAKAVTGYDGTAVFEVPEGNYKLVETRAPAGYQLSGDFVREITVNAVRGAVGEFKYTFNNEKTSYSIEIYKHDSEDKQKKLPVRFRLLRNAPMSPQNAANPRCQAPEYP